MKRLWKNQKGSAVLLVLGLVVAFVVAAIGIYVFRQSNTKEQQAQVTDSQVSSGSQTQKEVVSKKQDVTKLPLGDGKVTSSAKKGNVFSCSTTFRGGGAEHVGAWISGDTWNLNSKPHVEGEVDWPNAKISITLSGTKRIISGNGLPVANPTGIFPIAQGTTAYQYDRNPNSIKSQNVSYQLPANPTEGAPTCVGMGVIGYMTDGAALFNALDAAGRDAVAHEIQDSCDGHPEMNGTYHYHGLSSCLAKTEGNNQLLGYALDGFGIYGNKDENGNIITSDDLDECHGKTGKITWDGKQVTMYHYVLTYDYPYSIGCFKGAPVRTGR